MRSAHIAALAGLIVLAGFDIAASEEGTRSPAKVVPSPERGWPQFRGPRRDGICDETSLLSSWPTGGPKVLWSATNLGRGYSSPTITQGGLYITGDVGEELHLAALDLKGRTLWKATNGAAWKTPYPGSRATPTYSSGRLYLQNAHGRLACFDAKNGKEYWSLNVLERFGGENITWGLSECLIVDERVVYVTAGGREALVVALDKATGDMLWKTPPLFDSAGDKGLEAPSYVSPVLVEFAGRRLLIGCSLRHLFCVDANNGALQWTQRMPTTHLVIAMVPTIVRDAVFMTAPHGKGGRLFRLLPPSARDGKVGVEELWTSPLDTCHGGVVHGDGKLIGSFYPGRKGWGALDSDSGELLYDQPKWVKGAVLAAGKRLYLLSEDGWMRLVEAAEKDFILHGEFRLAEAKQDAWAHPVIHDGRLYLRYHQTLSCYDIRAAN